MFDVQRPRRSVVLWELPIQEPDCEHTCPGIGMRVTLDGLFVSFENLCQRCFPQLRVSTGTQLRLPKDIPSWEEAARRVDGFSSMVTPSEVLGELLSVARRQHA